MATGRMQKHFSVDFSHNSYSSSQPFKIIIGIGKLPALFKRYFIHEILPQNNWIQGFGVLSLNSLVWLSDSPASAPPASVYVPTSPSHGWTSMWTAPTLRWLAEWNENYCSRKMFETQGQLSCIPTSSNCAFFNLNVGPIQIYCQRNQTFDDYKGRQSFV